jgi:hypothetical protein
MAMNDMKCLCICQCGHSRSVALARRFHSLGIPAVAIGVQTSGDAVSVLAEWGSHIFVLEPHFARIVPECHKQKVVVFDVGPDRWVNPYHPELEAILKAKIREQFGL